MHQRTIGAHADDAETGAEGRATAGSQRPRAAALSSEQLALIAQHLKALSEPARLQILSTLIAGPRTVNEIVTLTGMHQANVSKHLQLLHAHGIVSRRRDRQFVQYALTDQRVFALCELVCASLEDAADARRELIGV